MIKSIQKYLLLHHPLLWNMRIVPMLLIVLIVNLTFFVLGYFITDTTIYDHLVSSYRSDRNTLIYFITVLLGLIILIGWLVVYNRNNGLKAFYPRKSSMIYAEWLLIFVITTGLTFIPLSFSKGITAKWHSVATQEETLNTIDLLEKVRILIPDNTSAYRYNSIYDTPIPLVGNIAVHMDSNNSELFAFDYDHENNQTIVKGYIGPSLLFYADYGYRYYKNLPMGGDKLKEKNINLLKHWLRNDERDSIYNLMQNFHRLQKKHNLSVSITPEKWMELIYRPPYFPIDCTNRIQDSGKEDQTDYNCYDHERGVYYWVNCATRDTLFFDSHEELEKQVGFSSLPYFQLEILQEGYKYIWDTYNDDDVRLLTLFCLCFSLCLSVFVFSYRATGGRAWLVAWIGAGVSIFTIILMLALLSSIGKGIREEAWFIFHNVIWVFIFIALLLYILMKVKNKTDKGKSIVFANVFLWLIPFLLPSAFIAVFLFNYKYGDVRWRNGDELLEIMFWLNIPITFVFMWISCVLLRKWKSLPEE